MDSMDALDHDVSTQESSEFPELAISEDESVAEGFMEPTDIPSTAAIPHSKIAWSIPVEIIFDKNEKSGIDEALSKGNASFRDGSNIIYYNPRDKFTQCAN